MKEIQRDEASYYIPKDFQTAVHEDILKGMKMDLIKLPEGTVAEEELKEIAHPFAESILKRHSPMRWQSVAHPVVGTVLLTLLTILLLTGGGLMTYMGPTILRSNAHPMPLQTCSRKQECDRQSDMRQYA